MGTYYVSKSGNDSNDGLSETNAWLTVTKAFQTLSAGDTCYIAPGIYREFPDMSNAGTEGNIILVQGDTDCEHFTNEDKGIVRITGCATDETPSTSSSSIVYAQKDYVTLKNLYVDGSTTAYAAISRASGTDRININCVGIGYYGFWYGHNINCLGIGRYGFYSGLLEGCVSIGDYSTYAAAATNCIAIGRLGFRDCTSVNCLGMGAYAFYFGTAHNCVALGANYGFYGNNESVVDISTYNCLAQNCYVAYYYANISTCKYTMCSSSPVSNCTGDTPSANTAIVTFTFSNFLKLVEGFKPFMFEGLRQWGTTSGITVPDTDILGLPRQMIGGGLDLGPYAYSFAELDWSVYDTEAPSVKISQKGQHVFKVLAKAGEQITVTCKCVHWQTTGDKPQLLLKGETITDQADTCWDTAGQWDTLSVSATPQVDEKLEVVLYARDTGSSAIAWFSDVEVS